MKRTILVASAMTVATGIAAISLASPASATLVGGQPAQVWYQSFQRSGPDAPCVAPKALDIAWQDDWPASENKWTASWALWPNGGTGGWVCNRQITWDPGSDPLF